MASQQMDKDAVMETQQEEQQQRISSTDVVDSNIDEVVSIELPAPQGWTKKFIPKKGGTGTPRRNEIVFIAPTGEEIKNKRQLDQYLKSHTDGPPSSDFDWGTGDTPRRSARLSSKPKATESPESGGSSRKRQRKSSSKKKEIGGGESGEDEAPSNKTEDEKSEDEKDVEMKDARGAGNGAEEKKSEDEKDVEVKDAGAAGNGAEEEKSEEKTHDEAGLAKTSAATAKEKIDEAKETKEGDAGTQPDETKPEEEVPNKEEQSEVSKAETFLDVTEPTKDKKHPEENKVQPAQEIVEQPKENKPEAVDELPSDTNKAMEVEPAVKGDIEEKGGLVNAENKPEGSNLVLEESVKVTASEDVGPGSNGGENQGGSLQSENQPVEPDGAPREPGAAQPISC